MIPADVVSQLQNSVSSTRGIASQSQEIGDKLAGLVAGQKVVAEIQAVLPNGVYRALISQRSVTLSLPFSAKAGDSLELLVSESDGKLALAVVSPSSGETAGSESVSATLSRTAQLISTLYSDAHDAQGKSTALPLNDNQPITASPPKNAEELAPLLKEAIRQSGMFYESHQAEWIEGRLPKAALQQEPQGKLSAPDAFTLSAETASLTTTPADPAAHTATGKSAASGKDTPADYDHGAAPTRTSAAALATPDTAETTKAAGATTLSSPAQTPAPQAQTIAPQLQSIVQQQLEALATQNFVWQGQVWPGQDMRWEIDEDAAHGQDDDTTATRWATTLRMTLPRLGEVDARIQLQGSQITLALSTRDPATGELMRSSGGLLRSQLDAAGLTLTSMGFDTLHQETADGES